MEKHTFHMINMDWVVDSGVLVENCRITPRTPMVVVASNSIWKIDQNLNGSNVVHESLAVPSEGSRNLN